MTLGNKFSRMKSISGKFSTRCKNIFQSHEYGFRMINRLFILQEEEEEKKTKENEHLTCFSS